MSDNILRLIPEQPQCVPDAEVIQELERILVSLNLEVDDIRIKVEEQVAFVDAGENWGKIFCPTCGMELSQEWWGNAMSKAWEGRFSNLEIQTDCCGSTVSLNNLDYEWAVGFAKFIIELWNLRQPISNSHIIAIEEAVRFKLKRIETYI